MVRRCRLICDGHNVATLWRRSTAALRSVTLQFVTAFGWVVAGGLPRLTALAVRRLYTVLAGCQLAVTTVNN